MNRIFKIAILCVIICMISLLFVSCGRKNNGDTSGNASNGVVSSDNGSKGGVVSEIISMGGEIISDVGDAVSDIISDILPDGSKDNSHESVISEHPSDVSFVSEGEVSNV